MFTHDFVRNAYLAGTPIALACGALGWFVVLRAQVFAGDALSHVAFVGAIAAAVLGFDERLGLFVLTLMVALGLAGLGRRAQADDAVIGTTFAWTLGIGLLLLAVLATSSGGGNGVAAANTLFGSIYSLKAADARVAGGIALAAIVALAVVLRPLLFSTLDPEVATVRGLPVRALGTAFLCLLAVLTADTTQAVGALLLLGLIAAPAGAAHLLTVRPYLGMLLAGALALASMWAGLALAYAIPSLPPSSAIIGLAACSYLAAALTARGRVSRRSRLPPRLRDIK